MVQQKLLACSRESIEKKKRIFAVTVIGVKLYVPIQKHSHLLYKERYLENLVACRIRVNAKY